MAITTVVLGDKLIHNRETSQNHRMIDLPSMISPGYSGLLYKWILKTTRDGDDTTSLCNLFQSLTFLKMRYRRKKINPYLENQTVLPCIVSKDSTDASRDRDSLSASGREKHLVTLPFKLIFGMTAFVTMDLTRQDSKFHD